MDKYLFSFLIATGISLILTPLIRSFAKWANIFDLPSERKIHKNPVPLLGGIPIFLSFNIAVFVGLILNKSYLSELLLAKWQALLVCQIIILELGFFDDVVKLKPGVKFLFQIFVGVLILIFGFGIYSVTSPFSGNVMQLGLFSIPVTIIWVVGITNALNLVDGLDGLAAGTSLIVCGTIFAISFFNQNLGIAFVSLTLAGSILGFLRYNFHPASIFLGDTGSLLLGFLLSVFSVQGSSKGATIITVLAPILALGFPIMETLLSMIRRFLKSMHFIDYPSPNGKFRAIFFKGFTIFRADSDHVHHRLLKLGFSQRKAVVFLYGICVTLSVLAVLSSALKNLNIVVFLGAILIAIFIGVKSLKYQEFKILQNGLLIPLFSFPVVNRRVFQAFFDLFMTAFSFYLSFILVFRGFGDQARSLFIESIPIVLLIKIAIFYFSGLYKGSWAYSSIEDIATIFKAIILSSLSSMFILSLFFDVKSFGGIIFFVLDFYFLLTFIAGFRISYRLFTSFYHQRTDQSAKKILIYGAGHRGSTVLREIRHNGTYFYSPVGFIDDDPNKKGKNMHGCPILGSIEDLEQMLRKSDISEIIISTEKIAEEKIKRMLDFCKQKGIIIRQFEFRFYQFP